MTFRSERGEHYEGQWESQVEIADRFSDGKIHWWERPDRSVVEIKTEFLSRVIEARTKELEAEGFRDLCVGKMGLSKSEYHVYWTWLHREGGKGVARVEVGCLKRFCDHFSVNYNELERSKAIGRFPINLRSKEMVNLKTYINNEGCLHRELTLSGGESFRAHFANLSPRAQRYFKEAVKAVGGEFHGPHFRRSRILESSMDARTAHALYAAGVPIGDKTCNQPELDLLIWTDKEVRKTYIQNTLLHEGSIISFVGKDNILRTYISIGRTVDITDRLSEGQHRWLIRKIEEEHAKRVKALRAEGLRRRE